MERKIQPLKDTDIVSRRTVSRRALLYTLGIGAAVAATGDTTAQTTPKPRDPCSRPGPRPQRPGWVRSPNNVIGPTASKADAGADARP